MPVLLAIGLAGFLSTHSHARAEVVAEFSESTLVGANVTFQRGVFAVDESDGRVRALCLPVKGRWTRPGTNEFCGNDPPESERREIERHSPDVTVLEMRNFGLDTAQWNAPRPTPAVSAIKKAFSYEITSSSVVWRLRSGPLPPGLRVPIPGSDIQAHFGGVYSNQRMPSLFEPGKGDMLFETRLSVPVSVQKGEAHSGLTLGVVLHAKTDEGKWAPVPVLVKLFSKDPPRKESIRSDGRLDFAQSQLGPQTKYVTTVENAQKVAAWSGMQVFSFRINRENVSRILKELNSRRKSDRESPFDLSQMDDIRIASILLRNESRGLEHGDVQFDVEVDYLRAIRKP